MREPYVLDAVHITGRFDYAVRVLCPDVAALDDAHPHAEAAARRRHDRVARGAAAGVGGLTPHGAGGPAPVRRACRVALSTAAPTIRRPMM